MPGPCACRARGRAKCRWIFANGKWRLDLDRLFDCDHARTRAIMINSPSNPVGWTASLDELIAVRDECRKRGMWIFGDEVYSRFYYAGDEGARAPSFLDICDTEEHLLLANTFSKNWAMTGWRVGWLQAPKALGPPIERIIQYNTSGTAAFPAASAVPPRSIRAKISSPSRSPRRAPIAISSARDWARFAGRAVRAAARRLLPVLCRRRHADSLATTLRIIDEAGVGFAPGATFGPGGEGFLRMCFLRDPAKLAEAMDRFAGWMRRSKPN